MNTKYRSSVTVVFVGLFFLLTVFPARAASIHSVTGLGDQPGGTVESYAYGINDSGQVVGDSYGASGDEAFIWSLDDGMLSLNSLLDASGSGWHLIEAQNINSQDQIVGWEIHNGNTEAFMLTPVPNHLACCFMLWD